MAKFFKGIQFPRFLKNISIKAKFTIFMGLIIVQSAGTILYLRYQMDNNYEAVKSQQTQLEHLKNIQDIKEHFFQIMYSFTEMAITLSEESELTALENKDFLVEKLEKTQNYAPELATSIRDVIPDINDRYYTAIDSYFDEDYRTGSELIGVARVEANKVLEDIEEQASVIRISAEEAGDFVIDVSLAAISLATFLLAVMVLSSFVFTSFLSGLVVVPLKRMTDIMKVMAQGDYDVKVDTNERKDEIGVIAQTIEEFRKSAIEVQNLRIQQAAMLDSLGEGLCFFSQDGVCSNIYSKSCLDLLETNPSDKHLTEVLRLPESEKEQIDIWLSIIFDNSSAMGFEDLCELAPKSYAHTKNKHIILNYKPMFNAEGQLRAVLLVAQDKTAERRGQEQLELREQQALRTLRIARNRNYFLRFVVNMRELFDEWHELHSKPKEFMLKVHTLKGVSSTFCLTDTTKILHDLERLIQSDKPAEDLEKKIIALQEDLQTVVAVGREVLGDEFESQGEIKLIENTKIQELMNNIERSFPEIGMEVNELLIYELVAEPVFSLFNDFSETMLETADQCGKKVSAVKLKGENFHVDKQKYEDFVTSLVHVARNIVDHGIEEPHIRKELGKPEEGSVSIYCETFKQAKRSWYKITIADDGAGIDVEKLRTKLSEKADPTKVQKLSDDTVMQYIFANDVSTSDDISEFSGRGVGMSAVKEEVEKLGGNIKVYSQKGKCTYFSIKLPIV